MKTTMGLKEMQRLRRHPSAGWRTETEKGTNFATRSAQSTARHTSFTLYIYLTAVTLLDDILGFQAKHNSVSHCNYLKSRLLEKTVY